MTTPPRPDPAHTVPPTVSRDDLQHALMSTYGAWLHLEHVAETAHHAAEALLAHDAAADLARLMWGTAA